jgi:hypothetical protein
VANAVAVNRARYTGVGGDGRPLFFGDSMFFDVLVMASDGNVNWSDAVYDNQIVNGSPAGPYFYGQFSTSTLGTAAQYSKRWWYRDFGPGGVFDLKAIHTTGNDVGIYSIRIDDREVARIDGYSLVDSNTVETIFTSIRIGPGRHRILIEIDSANPSGIGLKFYPALQGLLFRRTAPLAGPWKGRRIDPIPLGGQVIDLQPWAATANTNWDNIIQSPKSQYAYELYSTGAQNASRSWDLDLVAGTWTLEVGYPTFSSGGIITAQVDGVSQAKTIDQYSASTVLAQHNTITLLVPTSGTHTVKLLMATKNGSSSNYTGDVSFLQLRQQFPGGAPLPQRQIHFTLAWDHGNTNWNTLFEDAANTTYAFGGDVESGGNQNDAKWWYLFLTAGTWAIDLLYATGPNRGIVSVQLDDVQVGTLDAYHALPVIKNNRASVTGITVGWTGVHKVSLVMSSKNASSSAYYGTITSLALRRTA